MVQSNSLRISCCPLGRLVKKENITEFNRSLFNIRLRALQKMTRVTQNKILLDWDFLCSFSTGVLRQECINKWSIYIVNELSSIMFFQIFAVIRIVIFLIIWVWTFPFSLATAIFATWNLHFPAFADWFTSAFFTRAWNRKIIKENICFANEYNHNRLLCILILTGWFVC